MTRLLALVLLATAASAQPVLAPDSLAALASRAARAGLVADSTAARLASCSRAGVPLTRSAVVDAAVGMRGMGPIPNRMTVGDPPANQGGHEGRWVEEMVTAGVLTPRDADALGRLARAAAADVPDHARESVTYQLEVEYARGLVKGRVALAPSWLAADAETWEGAGLLDAVARDRLLADARAGRLLVPADVVRYLGAAEPTGADYVRYGPGDPALGPLRSYLEAGVRLLHRRGVASLRVEGLALDSAFHVGPSYFGDEPEQRYRTDIVAATISGVPYRQRVRSASDALTLLNRVLRDRRSAVRLGAVGVPDLDLRRAEGFVLALTNAQRAVLSSERLSALSAPRRAHVRAASAHRDGPCRELAFHTSFVADLGIDVDGPTATGREGALTRDGLARTLGRLEAVGLLAHLSPEERAALSDGLFEQYLGSPKEIIEAVPRLAVAFVGDDGTYGGGQPYAGEVRQFARASRGTFRPADVTDTFSFEADSALVGFTSGGVRYETTVPVDDWLYAGFVGLIAQATAGHDARLYRLGRYTEEGFAFLTREQWAELATLGLLADGAGLVDPADYP